MVEKVYCKNCRKFDWDIYVCKQPKLKIKDISTGLIHKEYNNADPNEKNKNNDCREFKPTIFYTICKKVFK